MPLPPPHRSNTGRSTAMDACCCCDVLGVHSRRSTAVDACCATASQQHRPSTGSGSALLLRCCGRNRIALTADVQSQWTNAVAAMQCSQPHRSNSQRSNDSGSALLLRCHGLKKLSKPPKSLKILKRTKKSIKIPKRKKAPNKNSRVIKIMANH